MPLCVAAVRYPNFTEKLEKSPVPLRTMLSEHTQPTKFFVSTGADPINPTESEKKLLEIIKDEPLSIYGILNKMKRFPSPAVLDSLIQQRAIQAIGFTPTDALHDPLEDVAFLNREITMWLYGILERNWVKLARKIQAEGLKLEVVIAEQLAGAGIRESHDRNLRNTDVQAYCHL